MAVNTVLKDFYLVTSHMQYHGEASVADRRRDVGDARGGSSAGSGGNAADDDLYRETAGNRGTVGDVTTNILSVYRGEGLRGGGRRRDAWWCQEATEKQLWDTLAGILWGAKRRRQLGEIVRQ